MRFVHRLIHWRYGISRDYVLNSRPANGAGPRELDLAADLLRLMRALEGEAIDPITGMADYGRLRGSDHYQDYQRCAALLPAFDPGMLPDKDTRLAFWINLYNALIIDAVIHFDVQGSVNDIPGFFWRAAYQIGGQRYNAFDIEYGILRADGSHPAIPGPQFGTHDPRRLFALAELDPRVQFALVCAARSCPPIGVYAASDIDAQLDLAARSFINNGGVEIDRDNNQVRLSRIFQWYAPDFGGHPLGAGDKKPLLNYVTPYLTETADRLYLENGVPKVAFQDYDWRLNHLTVVN